MTNFFNESPIQAIMLHESSKFLDGGAKISSKHDNMCKIDINSSLRILKNHKFVRAKCILSSTQNQ